MEIVSIRRDGIVFRNICIGSFGRRSHFHHFTESLGFLHCLLGPYTCIQIGSLLLQEVVGYHAKFQTCTATEEKYRIAFGNVEQLLEESYSLVYHWLEVLCTMADFHQRES